MTDLETITEAELLSRGAVIQEDMHKQPYAKVEAKDKPMEFYRPIHKEKGRREWYRFATRSYKEGAD